jgi:hypothetical protein
VYTLIIDVFSQKIAQLMMIIPRNIVLLVIIPVMNFFLWRYLAHQHQRRIFDCDLNNNQVSIESGLSSLPARTNIEPCLNTASNTNEMRCSVRIDMDNYSPTLEKVDTVTFDKFRSDRLASMQYADDSIIIHQNEYENCDELQSHVVNDGSCFTVVRVMNRDPEYQQTSMYNIIHYDADINDEGIDTRDKTFKKLKDNTYRHFPNKHNENIKLPSGLFRKVPKRKGRLRIKEKLTTFLTFFNTQASGIVNPLRKKLADNNIKAGDDLIVMVVNEGEIDLYMNFACSCQLHDISLNKLLVFVGSPEIVHLIEATGAMGIYHDGYGSVSKSASQDYLDRVFVDMMWYKTFAIFLILNEGINILFQDVDLVWFRDPFPYFHTMISSYTKKSIQLEALISDDGQRSVRYSPLYGNSGFYYFLSTPKTIHYSWSIMSAFDSVQLLGSHQNVFTSRLVEGLGLNIANVKILSIEDFPTGYLYHHNQDYMELFYRKQVSPYNFHM